MKKISLSFATIFLVGFACNFSVGTNKDLMTGLSYTYNGFTVSEVVLAGPDNMAKRDNEVNLNTEVAIVVQGLGNYELKDDKAYPGMSLSVTDKEGAAIIEEADLFEGGEGYPATDASILRGTITIGDPMVSGETYHVKVRIWDKNKPANELTAEVDLVVK